MNDETASSSDRSWLERLAQAFSADPKTTQDLGDVLRVANVNGIIDDSALEIMEGALKVADMQAREIMIPRAQMVSVRADAKLEEILAIVSESQHSRFPVVGESTDELRGILLAKELLPLVLEGPDSFNIENVIRPANIIPESKRLNVLLREFREQRYHMAIVVDEYGSIAGLVTIEDVLEEIVGEIEDETDEDELDTIRKLDDGGFRVDALTHIEDFNEFFDVGLSDEEFDTIGGLVMQAFGRMPNVGECVEFDGFKFCILEGDKRKISALHITQFAES